MILVYIAKSHDLCNSLKSLNEIQVSKPKRDLVKKNK